MNKFNYILSIIFILCISFTFASTPLEDSSGKGNTLNSNNAIYNNSAFNYYCLGALNCYLNASMNQYIENFTFAITFDPNDDYVNKPIQTLIYFANLTLRDVNINYQANTSHTNYGRFDFTVKNSTGSSLFPSSTKGLTNFTGSKRFAFTFNSTAIGIYIDGSFNQSIALTGGLARRSYNKLILMADTAAGTGFNGSIDDVSLYNRSLSAAEIVLDNESSFSTDLFGKYTFSNDTCTGGVTPIDNTLYSASNQVIQFCSGSFNLPQGLNVTGSNLTFIGNNTLIYTTVLSNNTNGFLLRKGTNNNIYNMNISGYGNCISATEYNGVANNTRIVNNTLSGCGAVAQLFVQAVNNFTIENNTIMNSGDTGEGGVGSHGIYVSSDGNTSGKVILSGRIYNNIIYNSSASSLHLNCQAGTNINNVLVQNNNLTSFTTNGMGVNLQCGNNVTVDNNIIKGASSTCFQFGNIADNSTNSVATINSIASNNNLSNCTSRAFLVYGSTVNNSMINNTIDIVYPNGVIMLASNSKEFNFNFEGVMPYTSSYTPNSYIYFPSTHNYSASADVNFNMSFTSSVSFSLTNDSLNFTKLNSPNNYVRNITTGTNLANAASNFFIKLLPSYSLDIGYYPIYVSALNITSPLNNQSVGRSLNLTFADTSSYDYFKIYLNDVFIGYNPIFVNLFDSQGLTFEQVNYGLMDYEILPSSSYINYINTSYGSTSPHDNGLSYFKIEFIYSNGTSINATESSSLIWDNATNYNAINPYPNSSLSGIKFWGKSGYGYDIQEPMWPRGKNNRTSYLDYRNTSFNLSLYPYNLEVGDNVINVTSYLNNGSMVNSDSVTFNVTTNALLNISIFDTATSPVSVYNLSLTDSVTGVNLNFSNSSNNIDVVRYRSYAYFVTAPNYLNASSNYIITNNAYQQKNITLNYPNTVNVRIYNLSSSTLIGATFSVISSSSAKYYSTSTGLINLTYLDSGVNLFTFSNSSFTPGVYSLNIVYGYDYNLTAYLSPISSSTNVTFTFYDVNGAKIEGVYVQEYVLANASYVLSASAYTDITGKVYFSYLPTYSYTYYYSKTGYKSNSFVLTPPKESNYDITVAFDVGTTSYSKVNVSGSSSFDNASNTLTFTYLSGNSSYSNYSYTVSKLVNSDYVVICDGVSPLLSDYFTCDLNGYYGSVFVQGTTDNNIFYGYWVDIGSSPSLRDIIPKKESAFLTGLLLLIITFAGLVFGVTGTLIFGVVGILIVFWLNIASVLTVGLILADIVICIIIIAGFKRR